MRYSLIDDIRGLAIINMIAYHTIFDLVYSYGVNLSWFNSRGAFIWEQYICWSFILTCGFCQFFSKNSLKEGLTVSFWGLVITLVLLILPLGLRIYFGVLTFLGAAILVTIPIKPYLKKIHPLLGLILSFGLFLLFRNINYGYLGFGSYNLYKLPEFLYRNSPAWILTALGFPFKQFSSADYFSFFPWYFLFLTGFYLFDCFEKYHKLKWLEVGHNSVLEWLSKNSLLIYIIHQPIAFITVGIIYSLTK